MGSLNGIHLLDVEILPMRENSLRGKSAFVHGLIFPEETRVLNNAFTSAFEKRRITARSNGLEAGAINVECCYCFPFIMRI